MRWKFTNSVGRQTKLTDIDAFWSAFSDNEGQLSDSFAGRSAFDVVEFMRTHFQPIHPNMMWEFGPALKSDGHRLIVTPEPRYELTELARTIVERAPDLSRWEFYVHRRAENLETAERSVNGRTGGSIGDATFELSIGESHLIDVTYASASSSREQDVFLALEALLGESTLNSWIGAISTKKPKRFGGSSHLPISALASRVAGMQAQMLGTLPDRPYLDWLSEDTEVSLLSLTRSEAADYARQEDRITAITPNVTTTQTALGSDRFWSERFSRHGEVFAYVKVDGADGLDSSSFEDRADIEDTIDATLKPDRLGCVMGSGHGMRYSYIDLALLDVDAAVQAIRSVLSAGGIPERSWILFYDREWADEWVGIYDETPAPPTFTQ